MSEVTFSDLLQCHWWRLLNLGVAVVLHYLPPFLWLNFLKREISWALPVYLFPTHSVLLFPAHNQTSIQYRKITLDCKDKKKNIFIRHFSISANLCLWSLLTEKLINVRSLPPSLAFSCSFELQPQNTHGWRQTIALSCSFSISGENFFSGVYCKNQYSSWWEGGRGVQVDT